jgi:hypothetical protein
MRAVNLFYLCLSSSAILVVSTKSGESLDRFNLTSPYAEKDSMHQQQILIIKLKLQAFLASAQGYE